MEIIFFTYKKLNIGSWSKSDSQIKRSVNSLKFNGKPAAVKQHEIDTLKAVLKHGYDITEASDINDLHTGSKVMVIAGPLKGLIGDLVSIDQDDWFLINFESIGNSLHVKIPPKSLKKI